MSKYKYLLFDLDGTLIRYDLDDFIKKYLNLIRAHFSDKPFAQHVTQWILEGTDLMLRNDGSKTNREVFFSYFRKKSGMEEDEIWQRFMDFYQSDFNRIKNITKPAAYAAQFLEAAIENNFQLVIATQPVFPELAIKQRLKWSGIDHMPFRLITDIDRMMACKPSKHYYRQLLQILETTADHCLMIGNEIETDMAAKMYGISTFYVDFDGKNTSKPHLADYMGDFFALAELLGISLT